MKMPMPVDYGTSIAPANYVCDVCGATGCKLWREYQMFLDDQTLTCCDCTGRDQEKDVSDIDSAGLIGLDPTLYGVGARTDQIGWRVAAVPNEEGDTFWGYTSVPNAGVAWWKRLPTRAGDAR